MLDDVQWRRTYVRVVGEMTQLGVQSERSGAQTTALDKGLDSVARSSNAAAAGLSRADKATAEAGLSASEAAAATTRYADVTTEAGLAASRMTQAQLRQAAAQERLTTLQASGTATAGRLAAAEATLISASDRATIAQERLGRATGFTSQGWQSAGRGMLIAGGLIAAGFAVAGKQMADFESRMALVRSLIPDLSDHDFAQLREAALTAGQAFGFTADQVAEAEAELAKAGVSVKDQIGGALTGALTLAAAGQLDVAHATEIAVIAMTQFHKHGGDVAHIADLFAAGADRALGSVGDLGEAFKYGGLAASQADWSLKQTVGTLAELAQAGQLGSTAGAGLAMVLQNLAKPNQEAQALMDKYKISLYDANGQMVSSTKLAGELHDGLAGLSKQEQQTALATIFTSRARRVATILTRDGADANREWIETVDAQGFAALQAAGKMDSLSGDVTKLKAALQAAFIGVGEGANGPLRELVQDVTAVVEAWDNLPAPVRLATEALFGVAGATAIAGGAALLFIPKWKAMNDALLATRGRAITARGALMGLGKISGAALGLAAVYEGAMLLRGVLEDTGPSVEEVTSALIDMGKQGGDSADALINSLIGLSQIDIGIRSPGLADWGDLTKNLDEALTGLVTSGHADMAAADFARISTALHDAGMATEDITKLFPGYGRALTDSANQAELAGNGIDDYGNAVGNAATETKRLTDAAKAYSDALHALSDPLFAMNSTLEDLRGKQAALNKAIRQHGADSHAAHQAQLDLASSSLDVAAAARTLATDVKAGTTSLSDARTMLHSWVDAGLLTASQAKAVAGSFGGLISKAQDVAGALHRAAHAARDGGEAIGKDLATGIAEGVRRYSHVVGQEAFYVVANAIKQARLAADAHSPSREMAKLGDDMDAGVAVGIERSQSKAADAAVKMTENAMNAAREAVQKARGRLQADLSGRDSMAQSIADSLFGSVSLSGAVVNGRVGNLSAYLKAGVTPLGILNKLERRVDRRHGSAELLSQIANAGSPEASIALARNILSGQSGSIRHLNHLFAEAHALSRATGHRVAQERYGDDIAADRRTLHEQVKELKGIRSELHELRREARQQGREYAAALDESMRGAQHRHHARSGRP